jgi:hypothetical protein
MVRGALCASVLPACAFAEGGRMNAPALLGIRCCLGFGAAPRTRTDRRGTAIAWSLRLRLLLGQWLAPIIPRLRGL